MLKCFEDITLSCVVTGTGRCGTVYFSKVLTSSGIPCTHEGIFDHCGIEETIKRLKENKTFKSSHISQNVTRNDSKLGIEWPSEINRVYLKADSSYMAAPYLDHKCLKDTKIIHLVRHPMKVINSFVVGFHYFYEESYNCPYHNFIFRFFPEIKKAPDPVSRAALYYIKWNGMIEEKSKGKNYLRHPIENDANRALRFLEVDVTEFYGNKNANHINNLKNLYNSFEQIPDKYIRDELAALYSRYYSVKI